VVVVPRLKLSHIFQHIFQRIVQRIVQRIFHRGNNRQVSLFAEQDHAVYLDKLKDHAKQYKVDVDTFILMATNK
jgi:galactokinase